MFVHVWLLAVALLWLRGSVVCAQSPRSLPSHGKIKLDSYNFLLRDVHPASQAQANYLQNRLYATEVRRAERHERQERIDVYGERQLIKSLQNYDGVATRLSAGYPTSARSLASFWMLVALFGDRTEVYDALSSDVPSMPHEDFAPASLFIEIVQTSGELDRPPLLLEGSEELDTAQLRRTWAAVAKNLHANRRPSAREVADFHGCVATYRELSAAVVKSGAPVGARVQAKKYLLALGALADALYQPVQCAQVQQYIEQSGYTFSGGSMLELVQHMLRNSVVPVHGSTAQVALAEVARPISRVLEQEIALRVERIDSLAAREGHRPYAAEYRRHEAPVDTQPGTEVTQSAMATAAGT
jgi:hypothetical protein